MGFFDKIDNISGCNIIKKVLHWSPIILVYLPEHQYTILGEPLQWGSKYTRVGKICDFRLKFYLQMGLLGDTFYLFPQTTPTLVNVNLCNSICMLGVCMKFMVMLKFFLFLNSKIFYFISCCPK